MFKKFIFSSDNDDRNINSNYNIFNSVVLKCLSCFYLEFSHLSENKFNHNLKECINQLFSGSLEPESVTHFSFPAVITQSFTETPLNSSRSIDKNIMSVLSHLFNCFFMVIQNTVVVSNYVLMLLVIVFFLLQFKFIL